MGIYFGLDKVIAQTEIQYHDLPLRICNCAIVTGLGLQNRKGERCFIMDR